MQVSNNFVSNVNLYMLHPSVDSDPRKMAFFMFKLWFLNEPMLYIEVH